MIDHGADPMARACTLRLPDLLAATVPRSVPASREQRVLHTQLPYHMQRLNLRT